MKTILRLGPLLLVPLVGLSLLNCGEEDPTQPDVQPETTTVQAANAVQAATVAADATEFPTLTATELLTDPWLELLLGQLTIPDDAEKIRQALAALAADVESGDAQLARDLFDAARNAVGDYCRPGELNPDDDVHLDVIDFFLDGVEEVLPEVDEGPPEGRRKTGWQEANDERPSYEATVGAVLPGGIRCIGRYRHNARHSEGTRA